MSQDPRALLQKVSEPFSKFILESILPLSSSLVCIRIQCQHRIQLTLLHIGYRRRQTKLFKAQALASRCSAAGGKSMRRRRICTHRLVRRNCRLQIADHERGGTIHLCAKNGRGSQEQYISGHILCKSNEGLTC